MTPTVLYIIAGIAAFPAAFFGTQYVKLRLAREDMRLHAKTVLFAGIPLAVIAGSLGFAKTLNDKAERDLIEVASTKYGVVIENAKVSTTLSDWKINDKSMKCRFTDDKVPNDDPVIECVGAGDDMSGKPVELPLNGTPVMETTTP